MSLRFKTFAVLDPAAGADAGVVQSGIRRRFTSGDRGFVLITPRATAPTKTVRPTPRKPRPLLERPEIIAVPRKFPIFVLRRDKAPGFVPPSKGGGGLKGPAAPTSRPKAPCPTCAAPVAVVRPDFVTTSLAPVPVLKFGDVAPAKRAAAAKPKRAFPFLLLLLVAAGVGVVARVNAVRTGSAQTSLPKFMAGKKVTRCSTPTCRAIKKLGFPCKRCGKG